MAIKVKNWSAFQHYKNRRPPWIRLYRDLLDDPDYHTLTGEQAKALILLWLIASEDENLGGVLPNVQKLSFRLRVSEEEMINIIHGLTHWLEFNTDDLLASCYQDASNGLAKRLQVAIPESESEGDTERKGEGKKRYMYPSDFDEWYSGYPWKTGKMAACKEWKKAKRNGLPDLQTMKETLETQKIEWAKENNKWVPKPKNYLADGCYDDEIRKDLVARKQANHNESKSEAHYRRNFEILDAIDAKEGKNGPG